MKRIVKNYLEDILKYAKIIQEQTINLSFEEFEQNEERVLSVMMALAIIGEASKNIPDEFRCLSVELIGFLCLSKISTTFSNSTHFHPCGKSE